MKQIKDYSEFSEELDYEIANSYRIGIFFHTYPDWDCLGSAFALRQLIFDNYDNKSVRVLGDRKRKLYFLNGLKGITTQLQLPPDFRKKGSLAIVVDTWKLEKVDYSKLLEKFEKIIVIDHHEPFDETKFIPYDLYFKDTTKISCSEIILKIAQINKWEISPDAASFLYCGLFGDSQGFTNPNVNKETFEAARDLIELGADVETINLNIEKKDLIHEKLKAHLIFKGLQKDRYFYSILDEKALENPIYKNRFNTETRLFYIVHSINIRGADIVAIWYKYKLNKLVICIQKKYSHFNMLQKGYTSLRNNGNSYSYCKTFNGNEKKLEEELSSILKDCVY